MVEMQTENDAGAQVPYETGSEDLAAFTVTGFTAVVESGGALYGAVRSDGRWETLRELAGTDKTIYGVASFDKECPKGKYRYTLGVAGLPASTVDPNSGEPLFVIAIPKANWLVFQLEDFQRQYGEFWGADPYRMTQALGWAYDARVGLHIDAYPESFMGDSDGIAFMMPVRKP